MKLIAWILCTSSSLLMAAGQVVSHETTKTSSAVYRKMPNAHGKTETIKYCGGCHSMNLIVKQRKTKQQWLETVQVMVQKGIPGASEDDLLTIIDYLGAHYAPLKELKGGQEKPMTGNKKKVIRTPAIQASR